MNNKFVQAVGVAAIAYLGFMGIAWAVRSVSYIFSGFGYWLRNDFLPYSWEIALALGVLWFLWSAVTNSKNN